MHVLTEDLSALLRRKCRAINKPQISVAWGALIKNAKANRGGFAGSEYGVRLGTNGKTKVATDPPSRVRLFDYLKLHKGLPLTVGQADTIDGAL